MNAICYVACANEKEAHRIAKLLLKKRLAACANILPKIHSFYWWNGKIIESKEALLLIKTTMEKQEKITTAIKKTHSYSVPCIEFIEIKKASKDYENWLRGEIR